jgi:hypothetical protein
LKAHVYVVCEKTELVGVLCEKEPNVSLSSLHTYIVARGSLSVTSGTQNDMSRLWLHKN